jgi:hypothetical protein
MKQSLLLPQEKATVDAPSYGKAVCTESQEAHAAHRTRHDPFTIESIFWNQLLATILD